VSDEPDVRRGFVAADLAAEHPGLWLAWTEVATAVGASPPELRARLRGLADRMHGAQAIALRSREVPHAYRVFFRHVGLDPDDVRTPPEAVALRRMREGGLHSRGLVEDALTVAVLETGVGLAAYDADGLAGDLELRRERETIVIADDEGPLAVLFTGDPVARARVTRETRRVALLAVAVPNVAQLFVEEALWIAWEILRAE
jgi:DNA/RNA-binding domain of Phe-tRNA-synthetase-like protein